MTFTYKTALETLIALRAWLEDAHLMGKSNAVFFDRIISNVSLKASHKDSQ